ncbi:gp227 [Bacillus phage W.Ph.]|uniref:Gp227 n=1 Tax=Bacillus phage W.Ph. TaxID=764595 RepID=G9B1X8_9CAUD|nr:gp227 [Bacillus phage W.Ph.]ADH03373.1 gp227 [Bacillus phage W.Ph.]
MNTEFNFESDSENIHATVHLSMTKKGKVKVIINEYETAEQDGHCKKQKIKLDSAESHRLLNNLEIKYNEYANNLPTYSKEYFTKSYEAGVSTWMLSDRSLFGIATCVAGEIHNVAFFRLRKYREFIDSLKILVERQEEMLRVASLEK